jgi:hypothetical protein
MSTANAAEHSQADRDIGTTLHMHDILHHYKNVKTRQHQISRPSQHLTISKQQMPSCNMQSSHVHCVARPATAVESDMYIRAKNITTIIILLYTSSSKPRSVLPCPS